MRNQGLKQHMCKRAISGQASSKAADSLSSSWCSSRNVIDFVVGGERGTMIEESSVSHPLKQIWDWISQTPTPIGPLNIAGRSFVDTRAIVLRKATPLFIPSSTLEFGLPRAFPIHIIRGKYAQEQYRYRLNPSPPPAPHSVPGFPRIRP